MAINWIEEDSAVQPKSSNNAIQWIEEPDQTEQSQQQPFQRPEYPQDKPGMGGVYAARQLPETELPEPFRTPVRGLAKAAETTAGAIGTLGRIGGGVADYLSNKEPLIPSISPRIKTNIAAHIPDILSEKGFREKVTEPIIGKKNLEAKNDWEQAFDTAVKWGTESLLPPFGATKKAAALVGGTAAATDYLAKNYAPKGWNQVLTPLSTVAASLAALRFGGKFPEQVITKLYDSSEEALKVPGIVKGFKLSSGQGKAAEDLIQLAKEELPTKGYVKTFTDIEKRIAEERLVSAEDLVRVKRALNENFWRFPTGTVSSEGFHALRGDIDKVLQNYGKAYNPEFLSNFNKANEMYSASKSAKDISSFVSKNITSLDKPLSKLTALATGSGSGAGIGALAGGKTGAVIGAVVPAALTIGGLAAYGVSNTASKMLQKALKSPEYVKTYGKLLAGVARNNKAIAFNALNHLNNLGAEFESMPQ